MKESMYTSNFKIFFSLSRVGTIKKKLKICQLSAVLTETSPLILKEVLNKFYYNDLG